jgi:glucose-1-phosphate thymidylyltransferase
MRRWWSLPSSQAIGRGELEITDSTYLSGGGQLNVKLMGRGYAWLDTGTHDSLLEAGQFIATLSSARA